MEAYGPRGLGDGGGLGGEGGEVHLVGGFVLIKRKQREYAVAGAGGEGGKVGSVEYSAVLLEFGGGNELDAEAPGGERIEGPADGLRLDVEQAGKARHEGRAEDMQGARTEHERAGAILEAAGAGIGRGREALVVELPVVVIEQVAELAAARVRGAAISG